ncbi:MAG TPA: hypothetical protein PKV35_01420 [bacterium]|nr:hypothetical protein [bacterium]
MSEKTKTIFLYLFLFSVVIARIILETAVFSKRYFFSYFVTLHHFCWYMFVFHYFALCSRYVLGMKRESVKYFALLSPVIFTPNVHSYFSGRKMNLEYMWGDLSRVLFNIATLYKFHPKNSFFFIEMVLLLVIFIAGSWFISKSVRRTFLNIVIGFYGSMILAGLHLFGVYPKTKAYFKIHTSLKNHPLMALIYFSLFILVFLIYSYPEIKKAFLRSKKNYLIAFVIAISISIPSTLYGLVHFTGKSPQPADIFLIAVPFTALFIGIAAMIKKNSSGFVAGRFFPFVFSVISVLILGGIILQIK